MTLRGLLARFARGNDAIAAIEFAIIAPVVVFLGGATFELGMFYMAYDANSKLAAQYAISYADCPDIITCLTESAYYADVDVARNLTPRLRAPTIRVFRVTKTSGTINVATALPLLSTLTTSERAYGNNKLDNGEEGVIVTVTYTHSLIFGTTLQSVLGSRLTMTSTVAQLRDSD